MGIGEIIVIVIVIIVFYSVFTMRKKPAGQEKSSGTDPGAGQDRTTGTGNQSNAETHRKAGYAKWVGGGLGWVFGGPIGAILGVALGTMFDGMNTGTISYRGTPRGDFAMSLLVLSAAVMKADQKVVKAELEFVRNFFVSQFGSEEGGRLISMLREILKQDIDVRQVSIQVGQYTDYAVKLQLVHYLFGIAAADGQYHPDEVAMIESIASYMGIPASEFASIRAMFMKNVNWAYDVLEITTGATDEEVKRAYREMAKKHHPDKVAHLGDDIRQAATAKFQEISLAWEEIKKKRGII